MIRGPFKEKGNVTDPSIERPANASNSQTISDRPIEPPVSSPIPFAYLEPGEPLHAEEDGEEHGEHGDGGLQDREVGGGNEREGLHGPEDVAGREEALCSVGMVMWVGGAGG